MTEELLVYGTNRTVEGVTYAIERRLASKGTVLAKLGDEVRPETVVAEGRVSPGFRVFRLSQLLGVAPHKVPQFVRRPVGARVYGGDIVAEAPKLLGMRHVQFLAPADGIIQEVNAERGTLTFQLAPTTARLAAGLAGRVSRIIPDEGVFLESQVSMLFGSFLTGKSREGALHLIASPHEPILPTQIDSKLGGHVVAGGSLVTKETINRCLLAGVKGIVTGGIAAHDLLEISNRFNQQEDVGLTILITSGLGTMPMEEETYKFLQTYNEQQVFLVASDKMLVVPNAGVAHAATKDLSDVPSGFLPLHRGAQVRILGGQKTGEIAVVEEILPVMPVEGSQVQLAHCLLRVSAGATITIPVTNVELVARHAHGSISHPLNTSP